MENNQETLELEQFNINELSKNILDIYDADIFDNDILYDFQNLQIHTGLHMGLNMGLNILTPEYFFKFIYNDWVE